MIYIILSRLLPHHNNVRTTTIVVVVAVHTLHIILKNNRTQTVQMQCVRVWIKKPAAGVGNNHTNILCAVTA